MSTTIKYRNLTGEQITNQQAQNIKDYYHEEYDENFNLRKKTRYRNGEFLRITYYLKDDESLDAVITELSNQYGGGGVCFNKQIINGYTTWDVEYYKNTTKVHKSKKVYDSKGQLIAYQEIDVNTGEVINTIKHFYLENLGPFSEYPPIMDNGIFDFKYNYSDLEPGGVFVVINLMLYMDVGGGGFYINSRKNIFLEDAELASVFNWANQPYYHSAVPLIPDTPNV
jgi:hypothetical protein